MPKLKKKTICIYLLIVVALYIVIAVVPSLTGALTRTEIIEHGDLTVKDDVKCYIVRDETVYLASQSGDIKYKVKEGTLVKRGTELLDFITADAKKEKDSDSEYKDIIDRLGSDAISDSSYVSQRKGNFTFFTDGYENYFTPEKIKDLKEKDVTGIDDIPLDLKRDFTEAGDPIYKISDNSNWYILCWIDQGDISKYETGKDVKVKMPEGTIIANIDSISQENNKWRVIMKTNRYCKDYTKIRTADVSVITSDNEGLLVSNGSITTKDDVVGVYVKATTGDYVFTPIQVLGTNGKETLVAEGAYYDDKGNSVSTVEIYDEVLKNPKSDKEGK